MDTTTDKQTFLDLLNWAKSLDKTDNDVLWFFCVSDARQILEMTTKEIAEMVRDGIKPADLEHYKDYYEDLDEDSQLMTRVQMEKHWGLR